MKYIYGRETSENEKVVELRVAEALEQEAIEAKNAVASWEAIFGTKFPSVGLAQLEKAEKERDELRIQLDAWHSIFGTSQLSHAQARLEAAEKCVEKLMSVAKNARISQAQLSTPLPGDKLPQRQDALVDQLRDLIPLADRMGCYDAADFIRDIVDRTYKSEDKKG